MDLSKLPKEELVKELGRRGEDTRGTKAVLRERLGEILKEEAFPVVPLAESLKLGTELDRDQGKSEGIQNVETQSKLEDDAVSFKRAPSVRTTSSMASARATERAKLAGLSARKEALKRKHELEAKEAELRHMREDLELQTEIKESEAREKVFEEMLTQEGTPRPQERAPRPQEGAPRSQEGAPRPQEGTPRPQEGIPRPQEGVPWSQEGAPRPQEGTPRPQEGISRPQEGVPRSQEGATWSQEGMPRPQEGTPRPQECTSQPIEGAPRLQECAPWPQQSTSQPQDGATKLQDSTVYDSLRAGVANVRRLNLPFLDLTTFKGDAASFRPFMQTFDSNIARNLDSEAEKLLYPLKFTKGKLHDIVQTCVHLPEELGYAQAVKLLSRRYDSQVQTVASLVDKILSLPALRLDDGDGLDDFGIYLRGCANALETLPDGLASVDAKVIYKLLDKVPYHMVEGWRRRADTIEQEGKRSANFRDLVEFIEKEARIATNSSYGRQALFERVRKHDDKRSTQAPRRVVTGKTMTGSVRPMDSVAA